MKIQLISQSQSETSDIESILKAAMKVPCLLPFDKDVVDFIYDFSKSILLDKRSRIFPELIVLANFFKMSNLEKIKNELVESSHFAPRGLVFHIAPSNVDSIFLYSSLISLLCGNVNLIRLSSKKTDQISYIIEKLNDLYSALHQKIAGRLILISYEHNDAITTEISKCVHMRVVWGGDETVKKIRSLVLRPTAIELCFPDRFSVAMLSGDAVLRLDVKSLSELCSRFYNDSIWFSQQACSSPRLVCWIGNSDECSKAREYFWETFTKHLSDREYENSPGMAMDRFVTACLVATESIQCEKTHSPFPARILLKSQSLGLLRDYHCGNGLFYEQFFPNIFEFFQTLNDRNQTLSVFGFSLEDLIADLKSLPPRSIDRITKIGNALDFDFTWDGVNLLHAFTRRISVKV